MGSAASALSKEQTVYLTKQLKAEYEKLEKSNVSDVEINALLVLKYEEIVGALEEGAISRISSPVAMKKALKMEQPVPIGKLKRDKSFTNGNKLSAEPRLSMNRQQSFKGDTSSSESRPSMNRQSSFKGDAPKSGVAKQESFKKATNDAKLVDRSLRFPIRKEGGGTEPSLANSESAPGPLTVDTATLPTLCEDMWDSVTQQPFCAICSMGFKTMNAMNRHVQFSGLHAKQVAKLNGDTSVSGRMSPIISVQSDSQTTAPFTPKPTDLEEYSQYKLLYSGNKLFWRTGDSIDISIYFHPSCNCVELIGYDAVRDLVLNRLYLDADLVIRGMEPVVVNDIRERRASQGSLEVDVPDAVDVKVKENLFNEEAKALAMDSYILKRIQLQPTSEAGGVPVLEFALFALDSKESNPLLPNAPSLLVPVPVANIVNKRKTFTEINDHINEIEKQQASLKEATAVAEMRTELIYDGAKCFTTLMKKYNPAMSKWTKKWKWAIGLVIRRKRVAKVTAMLETYERILAEREAALIAEKISISKGSAPSIRVTSKLRRSIGNLMVTY